MSRIPPKVAEAVLERAQGHCEACGYVIWPGSMTEGGAFHHRQPRGMGGGSRPVDTLENLMLVHHSCHNVAPGSIHQNPQRSYELGHLVRRNSDPADIRVQVRRDLRDLRAA